MNDKISSEERWTIDEIARRHHETGEFRGTYLQFEPIGFGRWKATLAPPPARHPWEPDLSAMLGIPVRIDDSLSRDEWRLVDSATGEVLRIGWLTP